jgi:hypothetical protein
MENQNEEIKQILNNLPKVENITSNRGQEVKNQFEVYTSEYRLFISYKSPIAMFKGGKVYIFSDWDYSKTTGKYRNMFLGETKAETLKKLKSGEYIAVDIAVDFEV